MFVGCSIVRMGASWNASSDMIIKVHTMVPIITQAKVVVSQLRDECEQESDCVAFVVQEKRID